jgi:hypothetical protein
VSKPVPVAELSLKTAPYNRYFAFGLIAALLAPIPFGLVPFVSRDSFALLLDVACVLGAVFMWHVGFSTLEFRDEHFEITYFGLVHQRHSFERLQKARVARFKEDGSLESINLWFSALPFVFDRNTRGLTELAVLIESRAKHFLSVTPQEVRSAGRTLERIVYAGFQPDVKKG